MANPLKRKRIDARATRLDISGNVISQPGERAYSNMHLGMDGTPLSGTENLTGSPTNFPPPKPAQNPAQTQPPQTTQASTQTPAGLASPEQLGQSAILGQPAKLDAQTGIAANPAPTAAQTQQSQQPAYPRSGMTTGDPRVTFKSPQGVAEDQSARTNPARSFASAMPGWEKAGPMQRRMMLQQKAGLPGSPDIIRQQNVSTGAVVNTRNDGSRSLASVYGTGSIQFPKPGIAQADRPARVTGQFPQSVATAPAIATDGADQAAKESNANAIIAGVNGPGANFPAIGTVQVPKNDSPASRPIPMAKFPSPPDNPGAQASPSGDQSGHGALYNMFVPSGKELAGAAGDALGYVGYGLKTTGKAVGSVISGALNYRPPNSGTPGGQPQQQQFPQAAKTGAQAPQEQGLTQGTPRLPRRKIFA